MKFRFSILAVVLALQGMISLSFGSVQVIYSNSPTGDNLVGSGSGSNSGLGQSVGSSGWYYNNVRVDSIVGINSTYARSGNGSVYLTGTTAFNSKGDIEFLPNASVKPGTNIYIPGGSLGQLKDLTSLSYDWYRDGSSTSYGPTHPALRLMLVSDDLTRAGSIVFDRENNVPGNAPTDTWVTDDVLLTNYKMWSTGTLPNAGDPRNTARTLNQWMTDFPNYYVVGVSAGFGSGWDNPFYGAVDNITFGFLGDNTTYNFEVGAVPEPMSFVVWGTMVLSGIAFACQTAKKGSPA